MIANAHTTVVSAQINAGRRTLWTSQMLTSSSSHNLICSYPAVDDRLKTIECLKAGSSYDSSHSLQNCDCHLISASPTFGGTREEQVRRISEHQWTSVWNRRIRPKIPWIMATLDLMHRVRNSSWTSPINPGKDWIYLHICRLWRE